MKKTLFTALAWVLLAGAAVILPLSSAHAVETLAAETETRIYDATKSYNGYFMPSGMGGTVYLMDMMGYVVHKWQTVPGWGPHLQEDGTLWTTGSIVDWDGNLRWSYDPATDAAARYAKRPFSLHHGAVKIWNKKLKQYTLLSVANQTTTQAEIVAYGADPGVTYGNRLAGHDFVIEIDMNKNIVWEWKMVDHLCQSKNPVWPNYVSDVKLAPERFDLNWRTDAEQPGGVYGVANDWWHTNSVDYNEDLDQVVVSGKNWGEFYVVDHAKTFVSTTDWAANIAAAAGPNGDAIWRWGNPSAYNSGDTASFMYDGHKQITGLHDIQWIRPYHWRKPMLSTDTWPDPAALYGTKSVALPGAGNFFVFDNGCYRSTGMRSAVVEINGFLNASGINTGVYVPQVTAGYTAPAASGMATSTGTAWWKSKQTVWRYESGTQHGFYSSIISGVQRLPNGNTSINAGIPGHMFEVTPSGEAVWEYLYPLSMMGGSAMTIVKDSNTGSSYRHYRYGTDYPGLAGRDLTRIDTLTGKVPSLVGSGIQMYVAPTYTGFGYAPGGSSGGGGGAASGGTGGGSGGY